MDRLQLIRDIMDACSKLGQALEHIDPTFKQEVDAFSLRAISAVTANIIKFTPEEVHQHDWFKAYTGIIQDIPTRVWDCPCGARRHEPLGLNTCSDIIIEPGVNREGSLAHVLFDCSTIPTSNYASI